MKKILITSGILYPDIGGPATYVDGIAEALSKDMDVTVLSYSPVFRNKDDKNKKYRIIRIWRKIPKPFRQLDYLIDTIIQVYKADIVYAMTTLSAGFPTAIACKLFKKKYFLRISGDRVWEGAVNSGKTSLMIGDFQNLKLGFQLNFLRKIQKWVALNAYINIAHSNYLRELLLGWGVDDKKIRVIQTGIDIPKELLNKEDARRKIGIPGNIILSVGRFVPWKGFKMLIRLMPKILEINSFFRLVIVGSGPDEKMMRNMINNIGLQKKIFLVGQKSPDDLRIYFASSDMFVLNSGYEGMSHLVLESMANGVPVITTGIPGNKEVIEQGENGFLVKYNDEFNIYEAIKTLWQNTELRNSFIEQGKNTAKLFSKEKMVASTLEVLNEVN